MYDRRAARGGGGAGTSRKGKRTRGSGETRWGVRNGACGETCEPGKVAACLLTPCVRCLSEPPPRAAAAMEPACVSPHAPHTRHGPTATDPRAACCVAVYIKNK